MKVKFLHYSMYGAPFGHPQRVLRDLGIKYAKAVPQSLYDCWQFFLPENLPEHLPPNISIREVELTEMVGNGLSRADVTRLEELIK